jgi:NitT/TauT family transport system permease protein
VLARARRAGGDAIPPAIALVVLVSLWELTVRLSQVPAYLLPAPSAVGVTLVEDFGYLLGQARVTLTEAIIGLAMGTTVGLSLGTLMAHSRIAERIIYPVAVTIRATPFIAIAPLFILWFGFTIMPKAVVAALATFFPMLVNSVTGLRSVDRTTLEFLRSVHASPLEVFWHLRVPHALPYFFASLRLCVSLCLIGAVVGELVGAREGLGRMIESAAVSLLTTSVFSAVIVLTSMGVLLTHMVAAIESRAIFWHESQRMRK